MSVCLLFSSFCYHIYTNPKCETKACFCHLDQFAQAEGAPIPSTNSSNPRVCVFIRNSRVLTKSVQQHFLTCVFDAGLINKAHSTDSAIHCGKARRLAQQLEASPVTTGHQRGKRHQPHVHTILFKYLVGCCRSFQPATQQQLQLVASSAKANKA